MGLFGKLFDKKVCDLCGGDIGLLGNRKLDDGNCCKDCAARLSPYTTDRRHSTVEEIRRHLAYREANAEALMSFAPTAVLGDYTKIYIDEKMGCFCVSDRSEWRRWNPDLIPFEQVADVRTHISEYKHEVMGRDPEGRPVHYDPPRFNYEYSFSMRLIINSPFFDEINFRLSRDEADSPYSPMYQAYVRQSDEIRQWLLGDRYTPEILPQFNHPMPAPEPVRPIPVPQGGRPQPGPAPMPQGRPQPEPQGGPARPMGGQPQGGPARPAAPQGPARPTGAPQGGPARPAAPQSPARPTGAPQGGPARPAAPQSPARPTGAPQGNPARPAGTQPQGNPARPAGGPAAGAGRTSAPPAGAQQPQGSPARPAGNQPQGGANRGPQGPQNGPQGGRGPMGRPGR